MAITDDEIEISNPSPIYNRSAACMVGVIELLDWTESQAESLIETVWQDSARELNCCMRMLIKKIQVMICMTKMDLLTEISNLAILDKAAPCSRNLA